MTDRFRFLVINGFTAGKCFHYHQDRDAMEWVFDMKQYTIRVPFENIVSFSSGYDDLHILTLQDEKEIKRRTDAYNTYKDVNTDKYPKYIKTYNGNIGTFRYLDYGKFPVYVFPGGERIADNWEIENGCNDYQEMFEKKFDSFGKVVQE